MPFTLNRDRPVAPLSDYNTPNDYWGDPSLPGNNARALDFPNEYEGYMVDEVHITLSWKIWGYGTDGTTPQSKTNTVALSGRLLPRDPAYDDPLCPRSFQLEASVNLNRYWTASGWVQISPTAEELQTINGWDLYTATCHVTSFPAFPASFHISFINQVYPHIPSPPGRFAGDNQMVQHLDFGVFYDSEVSQWYAKTYLGAKVFAPDLTDAFVIVDPARPLDPLLNITGETVYLSH